MTHRTSVGFWELYKKLPAEAQALANRSFVMIKNNPHHPSLHHKKVGKFWSVRIGLHFRALAVEEGADLIWFWIGTHAEYDQLV